MCTEAGTVSVCEHFHFSSSSPRHVDLSNLPTKEKGKEAFTRKGCANQTALQRTAGTAQEQVHKRLQLILSEAVSLRWRAPVSASSQTQGV